MKSNLIDLLSKLYEYLTDFGSKNGRHKRINIEDYNSITFENIKSAIESILNNKNPKELEIFYDLQRVKLKNFIEIVTDERKLELFIEKIEHNSSSSSSSIKLSYEKKRLYNTLNNYLKFLAKLNSSSSKSTLKYNKQKKIIKIDDMSYNLPKNKNMGKIKFNDNSKYEKYNITNEQYETLGKLNFSRKDIKLLENIYDNVIKYKINRLFKQNIYELTDKEIQKVKKLSSGSEYLEPNLIFLKKINL